MPLRLRNAKRSAALFGALVQAVHPRSSSHRAEAIGSACATSAPSDIVKTRIFCCFVVKLIYGLALTTDISQLTLIGRGVVTDSEICRQALAASADRPLSVRHSYRTSGETSRPPSSQLSQESSLTRTIPQNLR